MPGRLLPAVVATQELLEGDDDGPREVVRSVLREVLEAGMTEALGAAEGERSAGRLGYRSGYHGRAPIARVGELLDEGLAAFARRRPEGPSACLILDARHGKVREGEIDGDSRRQVLAVEPAGRAAPPGRTPRSG